MPPGRNRLPVRFPRIWIPFGAGEAGREAAQTGALKTKARFKGNEASLMQNGTFVAFLMVWIAFFILAVPLVRRMRHPDQRPFAAYLIFVSLFTLVAGILFALLSWLVVALGLSQALERLLPAIVFLLLVFVPAFLVAKWQAKKPRWRRPPPP